MIFNVFKRLWLRKQTGILMQKERTGVIKKPQSMIVVYDADQEKSLDFIEQWRSYLDIERVQWLGFSKNDKKDFTIDNQCVTLKNIKWFGGLKTEEIQEFFQPDYDLQINFFDTVSPLNSYIATAINASLKVGLPEQHEAFYDLAIDASLEQKIIFIQELKKYLNIIIK